MICAKRFVSQQRANLNAKGQSVIVWYEPFQDSISAVMALSVLLQGSFPYCEDKIVLLLAA